MVDRRPAAGAAGRRAAELRARDIVRRHGKGTLDYFALRDDKQWFFHRDSLVAYAVYGGICLVSPDPIGPQRRARAGVGRLPPLRRRRGWVVAVMGAAEEWLPIYRATGMHDIYIGDEAVVDVQQFSLAGGHMKGCARRTTASPSTATPPRSTTRPGSTRTRGRADRAHGPEPAGGA